MRTINVAFQIRNGLQTLTTAARYPNISRGWYKKVDEKDINHFKSFLLPDQVITDESIIEPYNTEWMKECKGSSSLLLRPHNTLEISKILQYCNMQKLAIVPQGGNTGLAHGSIPVFDEIILSMSKLNKVIYIDKLSGVLVCEAGCILKILDDALAEQGLIMPLDLAAKDSCQIGGNVATNAGGIRLIRYGSLRGSVLGLEMVLPDGRILDCLNTMRKDNTGYDLKNLFIGSEGTLGVITKVAIHCPPRPKETAVAFFGCQNYETVIKAYELAKSQLGETLSAFEFMDGESMRCVQNNLSISIPRQLTLSATNDESRKNFYNFYCLVEVASVLNYNINSKLESFGESLLHAEKNLEDDKDDKYENSRGDVGIIISTNLEQCKKLWQLREIITLALLSDGYVYKYDVSLPSPKLYGLVESMRARFLTDPDITRIVGYGHFGDGNLHLNLTSKTFQQNILRRIQPFVYEELARVSNHRFSISAEHGIGLAKRDFVGHFAKNSDFWSQARSMKTMFDPNGILNPYKCFPPQ